MPYQTASAAETAAPAPPAMRTGSFPSDNARIRPAATPEQNKVKNAPVPAAVPKANTKKVVR